MPDSKKEYEKQIIRFANKGVDLSRPKELVDTEHYALMSGIVSTLDGVVKAMPGATLYMDSTVVPISAVNSLRRLSRYRDGSSILIYGADNGRLYAAQPTTPLATFIGEVDTGFSSTPYTLVPYRVALVSEPYMFVGDTDKNVKVDISANSTKMGISQVTTAITYASGGAGSLDGAYDWRQTAYDSVTGAEGNPTDVGNTLDLANESADVNLVAYAQANVDKIRLYRRGGSLTDNWYRVTTQANASAVYNDDATDSSIASSDTLELDNDVPVTSVDSTGTTLTEVALPYLWGPVDDTLFGTGDSNRPDVVYFSKKLKPEAWPAVNYVSIDPNDKPMNGFAYDRQSFVFTRHNLYTLVPNMVGSSQTWTREKTICGKGIVGPRAFCVGERIWFCAKDGVYETNGASEALRISDPVRTLFPYHSEGGFTGNSTYAPIDFGIGVGDVTTISMAYHNGEVYLFFIDTLGSRQSWAYTIETKGWRYLSPSALIHFGYSDEAPQSKFYVGISTGDILLFDQDGGDFNAADIPCVFETGGHDQGLPRVDKEYGDAAIWMDCGDASVTVQAFVNSDAATSASQTFTGSGLQRYVFDLAGVYGRHIAFNFSFSANDTAQPKFHWIELAWLPHVEEIVARKSDWDDLGHPADKLVKGLILMADTMGQTIRLQVLYDGGTVGAEFTIGPNAAGSPRLYHIGFASFRGREVRIAPVADDPSDPMTPKWKFYGVQQWLFDPEPECLEWHEVYWGDGGHPHDKLVKGITIEADCGGQERTLRVMDDQGVIQQTITIGPGIAGIPAIYERSWTSFRSRNIRLLEGT